MVSNISNVMKFVNECKLNALEMYGKTLIYDDNRKVFTMCRLEDLIYVTALDTPLKVIRESDNTTIYGQRYDQPNTTFEVHDINDLCVKFGDYAVIYVCVRKGILYIIIEKRS